MEVITINSPDFKSKILKQNCLTVLLGDMSPVDLADLWENISQMKSLLCGSYNGTGKGLAAPQVGINKRFFLIRFGDQIETFINPKMVPSTGLKIKSVEACLSLPESSYDVKRYTKVVVEWTNESMQQRHKEFIGFDAVAIQHEYDHLNGILISDIGSKVV